MKDYKTITATAKEETSQNNNFDVFPEDFPCAERDAALDQDITEAALFYLGKRFVGFTVPGNEVQKAFTYGYICALHKSHTLNPALFIRGEELLAYVKSSVREALQAPRSAYLLVTAELTDRISHCLFHASEKSDLSAAEIPIAFTTGYKTAFICNDKYDRCLFMQSYTLTTEILGAMITFRESEENARRAAARIIMNKCGSKVNRDKFRGMIFSREALEDAIGAVRAQHDTENPDTISTPNDNGEPVPPQQS